MSLAFLRYLAAGAVNTALSLLIYWALLQHIGAVAAYIAAFCVAVVSGYAIHSRWVFKEPWHWRGLVRFPLVQLANLVLGTAVVAGLVHGLGVAPVVAPLFAIAATVPAGFLMVRVAVKRPHKAFDFPA